MPNSNWFYNMWRAIANEFVDMSLPGISGVSFRAHVDKMIGEDTVSGTIVACSPHRMCPPVLQFRPDDVTDVERCPGEPAIHYEWELARGLYGAPTHMNAALHFHFADPLLNNELLQRVPLPQPVPIGGEVRECRYYTYPDSHSQRQRWTCYRYRLRCGADAVLWDPSTIAEPAARAMEQLIAQTRPYLLSYWPRESDGNKITMVADSVWGRIVAHQGETFTTVRGKTFSYLIRADAICVRGRAALVRRTTIESLMPLMPVKAPIVLKRRGVRESNYIFAILTDPRISG